MRLVGPLPSHPEVLRGVQLDSSEYLGMTRGDPTQTDPLTNFPN